MKRDADNRAFVLMGPMEVPVMTFEGADPPRRVTIRGLPDKAITVTFDLAEESGRTQVAVAMRGFETLSADAYQERLGPGRAAWEKALANLAAYLGGQELPHPQGYVAALLGYRLETGAKFAIERTIWMNAPRERVWQALTDPQQLQQWVSPNTPWRLSALEVGGELVAYDAETGDPHSTQVIEVMDAPRHLVLRSIAESPAIQEVATYLLREENGGTRFILTHAGYETAPADARHQSMEQNAFGFGMMLENLEAYLLDQPLPYPWGF
jgi:uncharacterized protein YndB with AHSA1/START domain